MDDLISRAAVRDVIDTWGRQKSEKVRMGLLHRDLDAIPAVDAVPVIRCASCKWWDKDQTTDGHNGFCPNTGCCEQSDFYCADGERRENE